MQAWCYFERREDHQPRTAPPGSLWSLFAVHCRTCRSPRARPLAAYDDGDLTAVLQCRCTLYEAVSRPPWHQFQAECLRCGDTDIRASVDEDETTGRAAVVLICDCGRREAVAARTPGQ